MKLIHEYDARGWHRIVFTVGGLVNAGEWASFSSIAALKLPSGRTFKAVTSYHQESDAIFEVKVIDDIPQVRKISEHDEEEPI